MTKMFKRSRHVLAESTRQLAYYAKMFQHARHWFVDLTVFHFVLYFVGLIDCFLVRSCLYNRFCGALQKSLGLLQRGFLIVLRCTYLYMYSCCDANKLSCHSSKRPYYESQ